MAFKYSCFISYCHGQGTLMQRFVEKFKEKLVDRLDFYLDEPIWYDQDRLKPGYKFNEAIAKDLCHSVCMIVVYVPKYKRHKYCLREFKAMAELEARRADLIGPGREARLGMIIPIILRGKKDTLPEWITKDRQYCEFSDYALGSDDVLETPEGIRSLEEIAASINEIYEMFEENGVDPCDDCANFSLPDEAAVLMMQDRLPASEAVLPNRESQGDGQ